MAQKKSKKKGKKTVRIEASNGMPAMTLEPSDSAVTANDIRRIVDKLKGVK